MKTFSARKNDAVAGPQAAQGFMASNLVMPGLGSLAGGRKSGFPQLILGLAGFAVTLIFGVRFIYWSLAHWSEFYSTNPGMYSSDPLGPLRDLWQQARWPMLGMALFAIAWVWALLTSWSLLAEAKAKNAGD